jgi:uncharacterized membrane protein YidH (DUF202 family)
LPIRLSRSTKTLLVGLGFLAIGFAITGFSAESVASNVYSIRGVEVGVVIALAGFIILVSIFRGGRWGDRHRFRVESRPDEAPADEDRYTED